MEENLKAAVLEAGEELAKLGLKQAVAIAKVYAANSESSVDDTIVAAVEMLEKSFLADLLEKINPND